MLDPNWKTEVKSRGEQIKKIKEEYNWDEGIPEEIDSDIEKHLKRIKKRGDYNDWEEVLDVYYGVHNTLYNISEELEDPFEFEEIFNESFVEEHTSFESYYEFEKEFQEYLDEGLLGKLKGLVGLDSSLDEFTVKNTSFDSFDKMLEEGIREYLMNKDL